MRLQCKRLVSIDAGNFEKRNENQIQQDFCALVRERNIDCHSFYLNPDSLFGNSTNSVKGEKMTASKLKATDLSSSKLGSAFT